MKPPSAKVIDEEHQSLWLLVWPPTIWAVHFLASYGMAAVWCRGTGPVSRSILLGPVIAGLAVLSVLGIGWFGWAGWKMHQTPGADGPNDSDSPEDRHRFLGFATVLLAALSAIATVYVAAGALLGSTCK